MLSAILDIYTRDGFSLKENGLNEAVIPIKSALTLLPLFLNFKILILGGDLYEKDSNGSFINAYSDWYYEGESYIESITVANNYLIECNDNLYVSFVFKV